MKILTASQTRLADEHTITNEPISSIDLMERASQTCANWIEANFDSSYAIHVICGRGNNGGDGLAIARMLAENGYAVRVSVLSGEKKGSEDFEENLKRLLASNVAMEYIQEDQVNISNEEILIDALFGSGLNRPLQGNIKSIIERIAEHAKLVISIDLPSGLFMDNNEDNDGAIVQADFTLTFERPKLSFLLPQTGDFAGNWRVLNIGLDQNFIEGQQGNYQYITESEVAAQLITRRRFSHKGKLGHALIIAGEKGKVGAAILSAKACLRSGTGLLTAYIPECGYTAMQTAVPEAMVVCSEHKDQIAGVPAISSYSAIGIGPGIGQSQSAKSSFKMLIQEAQLPMVIDADAINILSENKTWLNYLPAGSILTPHPGEFRRLVGDAKSDEARLTIMTEFSKRYKLVLVLKGAHTAIASPDGTIYFNSTGNPGMATAGSGDVLTGVITALLAQGYNPLIAACLGVYFHGLAGDIAAENLGEMGLIAGDIVDYLPLAFEA